MAGIETWGASVMIYHKWSLVGFMLWIRYAPRGLRAWLSLRQIYASYLESPGTKAYSFAQARQLFSVFGEVKVRTVLTHGDLLEPGAGQRHCGVLLEVARRIWPREIIKKLFHRNGLFMLITATK